MVRSVIEIRIQGEQPRVAALFADPENNPSWMDDIERIEPLSGEPGQVGSTYKLVPKKGPFLFVATVLERSLPTSLRLRLDDPKVSVGISAELRTIAENSTLLISTETFTFNGLVGSALGLLASSAIRRAHRHHMEGFKRFAETHQG